MKSLSIVFQILALVFVLASASTAVAQDAAPREEETVGAWEDYPRNTAFEVNVLWPFFPGGMIDLKLAIPVLLPSSGNWRGELIVGLHSDFGWRSVRPPETHGQVAFLGVKIGWRQFLAYGLHVDVTLNAGWRHEVGNPTDGEPIHSFQGRLWTLAGYQHELTRQFYVNVRGGIGIHMFRTDRLAHTESMVGGAGDINLGFRFE